jgi:hypothetical protein
MVNIEASTLVLGLGLLGLVFGFVMPAETAQTEERCLDGSDTCPRSEYGDVTREKTNPMRAPVLVGGGIMTVLGIVMYAET